MPCYNLAHLLPDCINSILGQSYDDFEIIIMDDCSPDKTKEVALSFLDERVKYVRNEENLKHLANYNKGIRFASGEYVWLISADDLLRKPYILERYVNFMELHPEVGFVFCPAYGFEDGKETEFLKYSFHGRQDVIFSGKKFLNNLLEANGVVAASAMARKKCYEMAGYFPLDMPYAGDWYLWCAFSLDYDVAYFSEPMVYYRQHNQSMTIFLKENQEKILLQDDIRVLARVRDLANKKNLRLIVAKCNQSIVSKLVSYIAKDATVSDKVDLQNLWGNAITLKETALASKEYHLICGKVYVGLGDVLYWDGKTEFAKQFYAFAMKKFEVPLRAKVKYALMTFGNIGRMIMGVFLRSKRFFYHCFRNRKWQEQIVP